MSDIAAPPSRAPLRVAFFIPRLEVGGIQIAVIKIARYLIDHGLEVDIVALAATGPLRERVDSRIGVFDLGATRTLAAARPLARYLEERRPEVLIAAPDFSIIPAIRARKRSRVPVRIVGSFHNNMSSRARGSSRLRERLIVPVLRRYARRVDALIAVSAGVADDAARRLGIDRSRIEVFHNPVITPDFLEHAANSVTHPWLVDRTAPVVVAAGRLTPQKGFDVLLQAFRIVRDERDAFLMIAGEGPERGRLEHMRADLGLAGSVDLPGYVPNPLPLMAKSDLFVLSSRWEGLANVLVEALASGTRIVSTDCPSGPTELLVGGRYGILVPVEDPEALADGILRALALPRVPAPREAFERFTAEAAGGRYLSLVKTLADA